MKGEDNDPDLRSKVTKTAVFKPIMYTILFLLNVVYIRIPIAVFLFCYYLANCYLARSSERCTKFRAFDAEQIAVEMKVKTYTKSVV